MVENGIRDRTCPAVYRYVKANNKCIKNYYTHKKSLYRKCREVNNLYGLAI